MPDQGLKKSERLKNKKSIKQLLGSSNKIFVYPIIAKWEVNPGGQNLYPQVAFLVSKKRFSKANERNLIKRRIRESYRKNKNIFQFVNKNLHLNIIFVYIANKIEPYKIIEHAVINIIQQMLSEVKKINSV